MANDKKYNLTVAALWKTKGGNYMSMKIDDRVYDALQNAEKGGKFLLKVMPDSDNRKSPNAYLEYMTKADVEAFEATRPPAPYKKAAAEETI